MDVLQCGGGAKVTLDSTVDSGHNMVQLDRHDTEVQCKCVPNYMYMYMYTHVQSRSPV